MLCEPCQRVVNKALQGPQEHGSQKERVHLSSEAELMNGVRQGCFICATLNHAVAHRLRMRPTAVIEDLPGNFSSYNVVRGRGNEPTILLPFIKKFQTWIAITLQTVDGANRNDNTVDPLDDSTSSVRSLELAAKWYQDCRTNHRTCGPPPTTPSFLSSRLIYIDKSEDIQWRLIERDEVSFNALSSMEYMTLSHCWGDSSFLTLKSTDLDDFKQGKPLRVLPKVFQDAIFATKLLGCNMIWIDSLCIIQDSLDDWRKESADMARVYANAVCNIAATGSSGAHGSILHDRDSALRAPCVVQATGENGESSTWRALIDSNVWKTQVYDAPLNQRAWVFQERLLSRRILHFATAQLFWECGEKQDCEAWSNSLVPNISCDIALETHRVFKSRLTFEEGGPQLGMKLRNDEAGQKEFHEMWSNAVVNYTGCKLSVPTDKLAALFGIIDVMQRASNDECLAGLWRSNILAQLLWREIRTDMAARIAWRQKRTDDAGFSTHRFSRAPSWSWASLDGPIYPSLFIPMRPPYKAIATIIDARMQDDLEMPLAICSAGFITLETYIAKAVCRQRETRSYPDMDFRGFGGVESMAFLDTPIGNGDQHVACAFLLYLGRKSSSGDTSLSVKGLIIQAKDVEKGEYTRLGCFEVSSKEPGKVFDCDPGIFGDLGRIPEISEKRIITLV